MSRFFNEYEIQILIILSDNGESGIRGLMKLTGFSQQAIYRNISELDKIELVEERIGERRTRLFQITPKGSKIIKVWKEYQMKIDAIMS